MLRQQSRAAHLGSSRFKVPILVGTSIALFMVALHFWSTPLRSKVARFSDAGPQETHDPHDYVAPSPSAHAYLAGKVPSMGSRQAYHTNETYQELVGSEQKERGVVLGKALWNWPKRIA